MPWLLGGMNTEVSLRLLILAPDGQKSEGRGHSLAACNKFVTNKNVIYICTINSTYLWKHLLFSAK